MTGRIVMLKLFKRLFSVTFRLLLFIFAVAFVYSLFVVIKAKNDTPAILALALEEGRIRLTVDDLNEWQKADLLAVEDPNFYDHRGVDFKTPGAGLTTITQGLVKILYFERFMPGFNKLKQTLIARFVLDGMLPKDDQLTLFINRIYLGSVNGKPVHGFDNAALAYYDKRLPYLSEEEYLSIVAMIIAPQAFSISQRPDANRERTGRLKKVVSGEYKPVSLMDIYYGELDPETQTMLAPASYFPKIYRKR
jgi:membrane carboxypeptidase/penicillin-binding protein